MGLAARKVRRPMMTTLQRGVAYPVSGGELANLPRNTSKAYALWKGETRPPMKGEWFLSGAIIEAYFAHSDMTDARPIGELCCVERGGKHGTAAKSVGYRHGFDGMRFHPMSGSAAEYHKGYALGVLDWCWVEQNTIDDYRASVVEGWRAHKDETLIDAALRAAGVEFDWRAYEMPERAAGLRPLVEAAMVA